jgi:hypothetical protein
MRSRLSLPLFLLCAIVALAGLASVADAAVGKSSGPASLLYVQQTEGGSLRHLASGGFALKLTGVSPRVSTFTDRPARRAGSRGLGSFIAGWDKAGFAADPPNAALVLDRAPSSRDVAMLTLSHPRYDRRHHTLVYRVEPLHATDAGSLAGFVKRADPVRAGDFGSASLFVDNGAQQAAYASLTVSLQNAVTGQPIRLGVTGGSWVVPAPSRGFGSLQIASSTGPLPLTRFSAAVNLIVLETAPQGNVSFALSPQVQYEGTNTPFVTLEGIFATATVTWPTSFGPQTQVMIPGVPTALSGIVPN